MPTVSVSVDLVRETRATYLKEEHQKLRILLHEAREKTGLSRRALSIRLGKQPTFIARVERGERLVEVVELLDICHALNIDPVQVITSLKN